MDRLRFFKVILLFIGLGIFSRVAAPAHACGGLFCQNNPVDQNAERIIFVQNDDGTISAIIQIQYTGFDDDFSWILPLPEPIPADAVEVPETATNAFLELELATNPVYIAPPVPECAQIVMAVPSSAEESDGGVEVFASGEVGPYGFDIVGSEDPDALVSWLKENNYRVTPEMEPLINVYVAEQFVFLAMRLRPNQGVQDIQPVQVTYPSEKPMIPLRLTAVAANPDMAVITWFFAHAQVVPNNYAHMEISDDDIVFSAFGNNYRQLMSDTANENNGQAFVTEYAAPTSERIFNDPLLQELNQKHQYLTRLNTVISPEEMTLDPVFDYDEDRESVSNIHDLSDRRGMYDCEQGLSGVLPSVFNPGNSSSGGDSGFTTGLLVGGGVVIGVLVLLGAGILIGRRSRG